MCHTLTFVKARVFYFAGTRGRPSARRCVRRSRLSNALKAARSDLHSLDPDTEGRLFLCRIREDGCWRLYLFGFLCFTVSPLSVAFGHLIFSDVM